MAEVGDQVQVVSTRLGQAIRDGVVTGRSGALLRIRWSTGEETTLVPAAGSLKVTGKSSRRRPGATKKESTGKVDTKAATKKKAAVKGGSRSAVSDLPVSGKGPVAGRPTKAAKEARGSRG